jgi:hypothetical protein
MADRDHDIVQPVELAAMIMNIARRYDAKPYVIREVLQGPGKGEIAPHAVALDFHKKPISSEHPSAPIRELSGGAEPLAFQ